MLAQALDLSVSDRANPPQGALVPLGAVYCLCDYRQVNMNRGPRSQTHWLASVKGQRPKLSDKMLENSHDLRDWYQQS